MRIPYKEGPLRKPVAPPPYTPPWPVLLVTILIGLGIVAYFLMALFARHSEAISVSLQMWGR